jgi:RHS repeat-associated protein
MLALVFLVSSASKAQGEGPPPIYVASFGSGGTGDGQFDRPAAIAIAPDGDIWVADSINNRIQHFDSEGTYVGQFGSSGAGNGQFNRPRGIEFDATGNIWVLDSANHRLQKFNDKGEYLTEWGTNGSGSGQLKTPKAFAIDSEGNFWVADTVNGRIQKFSSSGTFLKVAGTSGPGDLTEPMGIDTSPEGEVFVADWDQNRVVVFDSAGEYERAFGTEGDDDSEFNHPGGLNIDTQGSVWVADSDNNRIQRFDTQGNYVTQFGSYGTGEGEMDLSAPIGITTDAKGSVWVTDSGNDRVQLWVLDDYRPTYESSFGSPGTGNGQFDRPADVAMGPDGDIWVADADNHRIQHFDPEGNYIGQFGSFGEGNGQFNRPRGIELDAEGDIWVLDSLNHRSQKFTESGQFLAEWGSYGTSSGQLKTPKAFAIDADGNFWVADTNNARIQKFSANGTFLKAAGTSGPGDLTEPIAIDTGPEGDVFVADWSQNRVVVFDSAGEYERAFGVEGEAGGQFNHPGGVNVDFWGNVWVGDSDNYRIQLFDLEGNYVTEFGSEGSGDGEMDLSSPVGITTDDKGSIWIVDAGNDRVQLWRRPVNSPETYIDWPKPTYASNESLPIHFSSDGGVTFKCTWNKPNEALTTPCTSPYMPSSYEETWNTFRVAATDSEGNTDPTPATYVFNRGIYPPAPSTSKLISPEEGEKSGSHLTLRSEWGSPPAGGGVKGVAYQIKHPDAITFESIPSHYMLDPEGEEVGYGQAASSNPGKSPPLFFDLKAYAEGREWATQVEGVKLRAVFDGGKNAAGASEPVTITYSRFAGGPSDATTQVGPATVDLVTGSFTMSRTDVSIPVPGYDSNLEFTRTYNSAYGAHEATNSKVLGPMWQPSAPVESEYEEQAWQKILVQHRPAVPPVYDKECWDEEGEPVACGGGCPPESCEEWMVEEEIPEANWVEVLDNEGAGIAFDRVGSNTYVSPDYAKEYTLTYTGSSFVLADPNGTKTEFSPNGNEYQPSHVSFAGTAKQARVTYGISEGKMRLAMVVAPAPAGVTCNPLPLEGNYAPHTAGCRSLYFAYKNHVATSEQRLFQIIYYNATGWGIGSVVAEYAYDSVIGNLTEVWDPRIYPAVKERYAYESTEGARLTGMTPAGEEPWGFAYHAAGAGGAYEAKLKSVSRASLLESPATATTTIAYDVPISGEDAPYEMGSAEVAKWGQSDYPVGATAIFPPDQIPSDPPSDYTRATVNYMDPDGHLVNTASTAPPGIEGEAIVTSETDEHGNVVRSLGAQARLDALAAEDSVMRAKELDSHSTYNADGTRMLESWAPLHEVRLESGETVQARAHALVEYDKGATEPKADEAWPNLPTKETVGAAIPGKEGDKDVRVTETEYNWDLRKPTATIVDPGEGEHLNLVTKTVYNAAGQVVESRQPSDPEGKGAGTIKTAYYTAGTNPDPDIAAKAAFCANKPKLAGLPCVSYPNAAASPKAGNPELPWTWITSYSSLDQPTETQEKIGSELKRTTTTTYDQAGRPLQNHATGEGIEVPPSETLYDEDTGKPYAQRFVCTEECEGFDSQEVKTTFDSLGRPVEYEDADGNVSEVGYDLLGRPAITYDGKGSQTAAYDPDSGVLSQMTDSAAGAFTATYDADGKMLEGGLPNGLVAQADYDPSGTPTDLTYEQTYCSEDCTWLQFERESSIHGQVLWQQNTIEGAASSQAYAYDAAGRLILVKDTEAGQCTTRAYSFDKNTNRTKLITREPKEGGACDTESAGVKQEYGYDTADRLTGEGVEYDDLGRITDLPGKYAGGGDLETSYYTSDLTHTQSQDGITNTYELDAAKRQRKRIRTKGEEESSEIYHYAGPSDSSAWIDLGESWTRNIPGLGGLGAIQDSATEDIVFQLADMHGDVVATADDDIEATELLSVQSFDEYGNPKDGNPEGLLTPKFGWLGAKSRRTELPSGVIQMGVRSYVPALGRFLTRDPVFGGSANAYEYAAGDPVNNFDLTGEKCVGKAKWVAQCKKKKARAARARGRRRAVGRGVRQAVVRTRPCTAPACTNGWPSGGRQDSVSRFLTKVANTAVDYILRGNPTERAVQDHIRSIYADAGTFLRRHALACAVGALWGWNSTWAARKEDLVGGTLTSAVAAGTECVSNAVE